VIAPLTPTIQGWLDTYLAERDVKPSTARAYRCAVKRFVDFAGPTSIDAAAGKLNDFIIFRCDGGSRHTAHFYRRALLAIIRAAHDADLCEQPTRVTAGTKPVCGTCGDPLVVPVSAWTAEEKPAVPPDQLAEIRRLLELQLSSSRSIKSDVGCLLWAVMVFAIFWTLFGFSVSIYLRN